MSCFQGNCEQGWRKMLMTICGTYAGDFLHNIYQQIVPQVNTALKKNPDKTHPNRLN